MPLALVTGASAGLGRELARLLAADGHDLVLVARRRERLEELAAELKAAHARTVHVCPVDLADAAAVATFVEELPSKGWTIDVLVNNAGFGDTGVFHELSLARSLEMVLVNVTALVSLTRAVLPGMVARRRGRILNVGSTAGFQPGPFMSVYYASKAFVNTFSEGLFHELRGTGVTVTVSCPGATATEFSTVAGASRSLLFKLGAASATTVARQALRAMNAGRVMVIHGPVNWLAVQAVRVFPRAVIRAIAALLNRS